MPPSCREVNYRTRRAAGDAEVKAGPLALIVPIYGRNRSGENYCAITIRRNREKNRNGLAKLGR